MIIQGLLTRLPLYDPYDTNSRRVVYNVILITPKKRRLQGGLVTPFRYPNHEVPSFLVRIASFTYNDPVPSLCTDLLREVRRSPSFGQSQNPLSFFSFRPLHQPDTVGRKDVKEGFSLGSLYTTFFCVYSESDTD